MSSVPMASPGGISGLGLIGCDTKSNEQNSPRETCPPQQSSISETSSKAASATNVESESNAESESSVVPSAPSSTTQPNGDRQNAARQNAARHNTARQNNSPEQIAGPYHRVQEVRLQQGISVRSVAKRVGVDAKRYRHMEDPNTNLTVQELLAIQNALEVPLQDLLIDRDTLSRPVAERALLVKTMKTAAALRETKASPRVHRLASMLCEQLIELMPELADVSGWPQFGARRGKSALGKALQQPVDTSQFPSFD